MGRPRFVPIFVISLLALIGSNLPAMAQQPGYQFSCVPDSGPQDISSPAPITCKLLNANNGPLPGLEIDGEVLAGSVTDTDGTTAPPDLSGVTSASGAATFQYPGVDGGTDTICFWIDFNQDDVIDEGSSQCLDDSDSEVFTRKWNEPEKVPVLNVTGGVSKRKARAFAGALGVSEKELQKHDILDEDGSIFYLDDNRFQRIPMKPFTGPVTEDEEGRKIKPQAIRLGELAKLDPISDKAARNRVMKALEGSGLGIDDLVKGSQSQIVVGNGEFELLPAVDVGQLEMQRAAGRAPAIKTGTYAIDTTVSFTTEIGGIPLEGPGSNFRVSFDPSGQVSLIRMAARRLGPGADIPVISQAAAADQCAETYEGQGGQGVDFDTRLIYFSPDPGLKTAEKIYPHYECSGVVQEGNSSFEIRPFELPAILLAQRPQVEVEATNEGPVVTATSSVTGGRPPYRYQWTSVIGDIPAGVVTTDPSVNFEVQVREETAVAFAIVKLEVTDADGLRTIAYGLTPVSAVVGGVPVATRRTAYGASWVGEAYPEGSRLPWPAANTRGFMETLGDAGVKRNYAFGEQLAYETDWVDPDLRATGSDDMYADNVDIFWFTGHANGDRFLLSDGASHDDRSVAYNDVNWGDRDLEWASIAACGPLQQTTGAGELQSRWGPAFQGLHILNGYATVSNDGDREGRTFASYLVGAGDAAPKTVRRAWSLMAIDAQGPSVIHGSMGVIGAGGLSTINDFFWGHGSVGPDLRGADIAAYWVLRYPS